MRRWARTLFEAVRDVGVRAAGGPARLQVVLILAAVLGLDTADKGAISAVSGQLKQAFGIGNTEFGLLLAVVSFMGAAGAMPAGILADRISRKAVLLVAIPLWAAAMVVSGTATSYVYLLITRLAFGAVTAAAWPCVASLTGDYFRTADRARMFGLIISGELIGAGIGFFISGEVASFSSWRWGFYAMAVPSVAIAWAVWRYLPEPERGTQAWIAEGESDAFEASRTPPAGERHREPSGQDAERGSTRDMIRQQGVEPRREMVADEDPAQKGWWAVVRYLLRLPTYLTLIAASSLVYYFFSGFRAFAMIYFRGHFNLAQSVVTAFVVIIGLGGLAGLFAGGHLSEWLRRRGRFDARIIITGIALFVSAVLLGFGIWTASLAAGVVLLMAGAAALGIAGPPIDAARLDIVPSRLWGRGESGRMVLRSLAEGAAPLVFGAVSEWLGGNRGLMWTFLIMLVALLVASSLAAVARRTYARDVATAAATESCGNPQRGEERGRREAQRQSEAHQRTGT